MGLTEKQRAVVDLKENEGLTDEAIAKRIGGIRRSAVTRLLSRARKRQYGDGTASQSRQPPRRVPLVSLPTCI